MADPTPMNRPHCLDAALDYEKLGFSVILVYGIVDGRCTCGKPDCGRPGKHPIRMWKDAQTKRATPEELTEDFARYPDANVGIVTGQISGTIVIDLDGSTGMDSCMRVLRAQHPPTSPTVKTGGGYHLYGRHPGTPLKNFVKTYPGLDGRADGGYVVAPPSRHASGREYKWTKPLEGSLPDLSPELLALFSSAGERPPDKAPKQRRHGTPASAERPEIPAPMLHVSNQMKRYAEQALANECVLVATAEIGAQEVTLSTAGLKIGHYVGAGLLGFEATRDTFVEAGLQMANDPKRSPMDAP